nr:transposase [Paenibacillus terrae]
MRVVTSLMILAVEEVATMYKGRWQMELFFRWIK